MAASLSHLLCPSLLRPRPCRLLCAAVARPTCSLACAVLAQQLELAPWMRARPAQLHAWLLLLLLQHSPTTAKKKARSPAKKVGFLHDKTGREAYADFVFTKYDKNGDSFLSEVEIDEANDNEPPVLVKKGYEDSLEVFDIDLLDKETIDSLASRSELLAKLATIEDRRQKALGNWYRTSTCALGCHLHPPPFPC